MHKVPIFILCYLLFYLTACDKTETGPQPVILTGSIMGTTYTVKINGSVDQDTTTAIHTELENKLQAINASMSTWLQDSELSRINQAAAEEWLPLSAPLFEVLLAAFQVNQQSIGYFDITVGPLVNLWGFGPENREPGIPDDDAITEAMASVGMDKLLLDTNNRTLNKTLQDTYIDLSGIAKGYGVDSLGQILKQKFNLHDYMVEIGGEITASGINPDGVPWQIGIEKPLVKSRDIDSVVSLENSALASSGEYRNFFEIDGKKYSHTIDPLTGRPVTHDLVAVTVIHSQCMLADAWATALLAAGPDLGMQLANMNKLAAQFTIREDGKFRRLFTSSFRNHLQE